MELRFPRPGARSDAKVDKAGVVVKPAVGGAIVAETASENARLPVADVGSSVGGKALAGEVQLVRVPGRDVDVILPAGASFERYIDGIFRSGAFSAQGQNELAALQQMKSKAAPSPRDGADKRPAVGIVLSEPRMLIKDRDKTIETIIALVEEMGCRPVLIPPCADLVVTGGSSARSRALAAIASSFDGLVGPGGADVDPSIYGKPNTHSRETNVFRDRFEADFVKVALDCDLFAFGICRSHQLWNAAAGGSLIQDLQAEGVTSVSHEEGHHTITVTKKSMIFEATRQEALRVNTYHHQGVDFTGWGFRPVAVSRDEGTGKDTVEASERWNGITTQYHVELMQDDPLQRALFAVLGRRAHVFALVKELWAHTGQVTLPTLIERMKSDAHYDATDFAWAKEELGRRLSRRA